MTRLRPHRFGLAIGSFLALWHAMWAMLVWTGAAQPLMDFIFALHMITPAYKIAAFHLPTALALICVTAVIGYFSGWVFGYVWNRAGSNREDGPWHWKLRGTATGA